ncbi:unnamed protein product [Owenia fusiformis]|uniref:Uncharacterized protein n=1 Tax=Owenia fusiformis TaxID=6347 RepID=A0A8J1TR76_OWEFU|nr:unnamed protein product [Owenia fusiformis]
MMKLVLLIGFALLATAFAETLERQEDEILERKLMALKQEAEEAKANRKIKQWRETNAARINSIMQETREAWASAGERILVDEFGPETGDFVFSFLRSTNRKQFIVDNADRFERLPKRLQTKLALSTMSPEDRERWKIGNIKGL